MAAGKNIPSDEIRRRLEQAGDDYFELGYMIGDLKLLNDGTERPKTAHEAKRLIQSLLDADETTTRDNLQDLERTIMLLIPTLEKGRKLELESNNFYRRTIEVLQSSDVPIFLKYLLDVHIPDCNDILPKRSAKLESAEVRIMLLGETCAGKSSIMNLFMTGNYLPVDHGQCTRITCELKDSKYRRACIHYDERLRLDPTELELTTYAETPVWHRVKQCISLGYDPEQNQEVDERKQVEKVVILWPILHMKIARNNDDKAKCENTEEQALKECPWIQATFVDNPGFDANEDTFSDLKLRAESCDAYIFVINNGSHHGVEADRVQKMMTMLKKNAEHDDTIVNLSGTLFICNKWDMVSSNRKESFKTEILQRLQNTWPGITKEQLLPFTASQALEETIAGKISEEYCDFMRHICNAVENAVHIKLENHCFWLIRLLETASALGKNCKRLSDYAKQQKELLLQRAKYYGDILSELSAKCTDTTGNFKKTGLDQLKGRIRSCVKANESELCEWSLGDIPSQEPGENWAEYRQLLDGKIKNRIKTTIMNDIDVLSVIIDYEKKLDQLNEACNKKEFKLYMVELVNADESTRRSFFQTILSIMNQVLSIFFRREHHDVLLRDTYLKDIPENECNREESFSKNHLNYMKTRTTEHMKSITGSRLSAVAIDISEDVQCKAEKLKENIQKGRKTLYAFSEVVSSQQMNDFKSDELKTILNDCRNFFFFNVLKHEIDCKRLLIDKDNANDLIGRGGFGYVLKGSLKEERVSIPIAAKIIQGSDLKTLSRECFLMRQLMLKANIAEGGEFPHVVRYFGSMYSRTDDTYELIMVMERCDTDLLRQVKIGSLIHLDIANTIQFPGATRGHTQRTRLKSMSYALDIALQAAKGLCFIHKCDIVHRDVKPSNILMSVRENHIFVKIADVGVSKEHNIITTRGQKIGTVLYHSPEIHLNPLTNHSAACDVYSFGLVLWEVWYGKHVFHEIPIKKLEKHIMCNTPDFKDVSPPATLKALMETCWNENPTIRPNMKKVVEALTKIAEQNSRTSF